MNKRFLFPLLLTTALLAPPVAHGATRYATPDGTGPATTCAQDAPCSLEGAMDYDFVRNGDEIVIGPGEYDNVGQLGTDKAVDIHGAPGAARPVIHSVGGTPFYLDDDELRISDLVIDHQGSGVGLWVTRGTAERMEVHTQSATACLGAWATFRDTACVSAAAAAFTSGYSNPYTYTLRLRNVTAVSLGATVSSYGLSISGDQGNQITVDAKNVIAFASNPAVADIYASAGSGASSTEIDLEGSNYDTVSVNNSTVTEAGTGTNRDAPPLFADLEAGDVRPAAGSPTIDAGVEDALNGTTDVTGAPRVQGAAIDAGAHESVPEPPQDPEDPNDPQDPADPANPADPPSAAGTPETTITKAPRKRTHRRRATLRFAADTTARFECSVDSGQFVDCSSPLKVRVKRGRHTVAVRAIGPDGKVDPSPATATWRVIRRSRVL